MAVARARFIPELLQVHLEDLGFVAGQRREALKSRQHTLREFGELNERLEGHLQGALVAPPAMLVDQIQAKLAASERDEVFASAYVLLRQADATSTHAVMVEFSRARGDTLAGLREALSTAPPALFIDEMRSVLEKAKPITAVSAAAVLANHRCLEGLSRRFAQLLEDPDPSACELAWRAAALVDAGAPESARTRPYKHALAHASPAVRRAAWAAAAWSGQMQAMPLLRHVAADGDEVALQWLAVLGSGEDAPLLHKAALEMADVRARCDLLARFGLPAALNALVRWMDGDDVALAAAAGEAFTRITGADIRGERRQLPVPDDADDFTREMSPDVWLPDVKKARTLVVRHADEWSTGIHWCKGRRLDGAVPRDVLVQLDLEARWDVAARAALAGRPISAPPPIY